VIARPLSARDRASEPFVEHESRPGVQGSGFRGTTPQQDSAATSVRSKSVERGVGVWVAARWGVSARAALQHSAEAAPSAIPPSWLALHRPIAVSVEMQGKDLDVPTNAATVRQFLSAMGIEPDGDARVASPLQTPLQRPPGPVRDVTPDLAGSVG
jgi:hypothetical protein